MSFKIVSTVSVNASREGVKPVSHDVLTREKQLHPGEKILIKGSITHDVEARGGWINARGEIRVIDDKTLGIRWRPTVGEGVFHSLESETTGLRSKINEAQEYLGWSKERIVKAPRQKAIVDLQDSYEIPDLPEIFNSLDRLRIGSLTEKAMKKIEGYKTVERKTKLIYEP